MTDKHNEKVAEQLIEKVEALPDYVKKAFMKRSMDDARELLDSNDPIDLQKTAYAIYRAYTLGAALYDGDRIINVAEKKDDIDNGDIQQTVHKKAKVIRIEELREKRA
jgi:hypothetical protein